jgi:Bacterial TniB protein
MSPDSVLPFQRKLLEAVSLAASEVLAGAESRGILLSGDSGVGKTHAFDLIAGKYPQTVDGSQRISPCVRTRLATKANARSISASLLKQLNRPLRESERVDHEALLHEAMRAQRTRIVLLEEVHNGLVASEAALRKQNADFLKNLWNGFPEATPQSWTGLTTHQRQRHSVVIVASGVDVIRTAFARDSELHSRYGTVIAAPKLGLFPESSMRAFREVARSLVARHGLSQWMDVNDDALAARLILACDAHLRVLDSLLLRAASLLRSPDTSPADLLTVLSDAFRQVATERAMTFDPFVLDSSALGAAVFRQRQALESLSKRSSKKREG